MACCCFFVCFAFSLFIVLYGITGLRAGFHCEQLEIGVGNILLFGRSARAVLSVSISSKLLDHSILCIEVIYLIIVVEITYYDVFCSYFVATSFLQYIVGNRWEADYVFVGKHAKDGEIGVRSTLARYEEFYTITLGIIFVFVVVIIWISNNIVCMVMKGRPTPNYADHASLTVSITKFFDVNGVFVRQNFIEVLQQLLNSYKEKKKD